FSSLIVAAFAKVCCRVSFEQDSAFAELAQTIARISEGAVGHRKTAAADAPVKLVTQLNKAAYAVSQHVSPTCGELSPVVHGGGSVGRELGQRRPDRRQRNAGALSHLDDGDAAQDVAGIATLVAIATPSLDQPLC